MVPLTLCLLTLIKDVVSVSVSQLPLRQDLLCCWLLGVLFILYTLAVVLIHLAEVACFETKLSGLKKAYFA